MWIIKLTPTEQAMEMGAMESIQTVQSDDVRDLFKHPSGDWRWETITRLLDTGMLHRVEVDYIPTTTGLDPEPRRPVYA